MSTSFYNRSCRPERFWVRSTTSQRLWVKLWMSVRRRAKRKKSNRKTSHRPSNRHEWNENEFSSGATSGQCLKGGRPSRTTQPEGRGNPEKIDTAGKINKSNIYDVLSSSNIHARFLFFKIATAASIRSWNAENHFNRVHLQKATLKGGNEDNPRQTEMSD